MSGLGRVAGLAGHAGLTTLLLVLCLANGALPGSVLFWVELVWGAMWCCCVPSVGAVVVVGSGLCLVSGLWVWHSLARKVRGLPSARSATGILAHGTLVL